MNGAPMLPQQALEADQETLKRRSTELKIREGHTASKEADLEATGANASTDAPRTLDLSAPPDGGYGWVIVLCVFWVNAFTWGVNAAYSIYLGYYLNNNIFPGASRLSYAFIGGLSISLALLIAPVATSITRLYTFRTTMALGVALQCGGLIGASFATKIWHLVLSQGIAAGFGMGLIFVATVGIPSQWFMRRRSLANGLVSGGSGVGGVIWSLATNAIIVNVSLAWAFRITAICCLFVHTLSLCFLRDRNAHIKPSQKAFDVKLLVRPQFIFVNLWGVFSMLGYIVLLYSLADYAISIGLSDAQGSVVAAMLSVGITFGRPLVGYFSDTVGRLNMATAATLFCGITCFAIWIPAKTYGVCILFALLSGSACGTFWGTAAPVTAEVVGLAHLPSALSLLWLAVVLPCTFSEAIGLELRQQGGGYLNAQVFAGVMYVAAAGCMWVVRMWKIRQISLDGETKPVNGVKALWAPGRI